MKQEHSTSFTEVWIAMFFVLFALWVCIKYLPRQDGRVYDCSKAEINPDFPLASKMQCRKQMIGK